MSVDPVQLLSRLPAPPSSSRQKVEHVEARLTALRILPSGSSSLPGVHCDSALELARLAGEAVRQGIAG